VAYGFCHKLQIQDSSLKSQMHFPEYREFLFYSLNGSAQRKEKKKKNPKLLLLNGRLPEI
jgi:hypothetical protein